MLIGSPLKRLRLKGHSKVYHLYFHVKSPLTPWLSFSEHVHSLIFFFGTVTHQYLWSHWIFKDCWASKFLIIKIKNASSYFSNRVCSYVHAWSFLTASGLRWYIHFKTAVEVEGSLWNTMLSLFWFFFFFLLWSKFAHRCSSFSS